MTLVIGITGSIGMGKSLVTSQFAQLGAATLSSDAVVHQLLATGGAGVAPVAKLFPETRMAGAIDRKKLGARVFADEAALKQLEAILHPLVQAAEERFVRRMQALGKRAVALDIPLLFEANSHLRCDVTVTVSAPAFIQRQRVLCRSGMTELRLAQILARQWPDAEKRHMADAIVLTGLGRAASFRQVKQLMQEWSCSAK